VTCRYLKAGSCQGLKKIKEDPGGVRYLTAEDREALHSRANCVLRLGTRNAKGLRVIP